MLEPVYTKCTTCIHQVYTQQAGRAPDHRAVWEIYISYTIKQTMGRRHPKNRQDASIFHERNCLFSSKSIVFFDRGEDYFKQETVYVL